MGCHKNWISWFKKMSVLLRKWRYSNKRFAYHGGKTAGVDTAWRNYVSCQPVYWSDAKMSMQSIFDICKTATLPPCHVTGRNSLIGIASLSVVLRTEFDAVWGFLRICVCLSLFVFMGHAACSKSWLIDWLIGLIILTETDTHAQTSMISLPLSVLVTIPHLPLISIINYKYDSVLPRPPFFLQFKMS